MPGLVALDSEYTSIVDGDPAYAVQQAVAYEVAMLRQRINDAGKANLVTSAIGADLDNLGANVNTYRRVLQYADDTVDPAAGGETGIGCFPIGNG